MMISKGTQKISKETCCSATLPTINLTWSYLALNPGLRSDLATWDFKEEYYFKFII